MSRELKTGIAAVIIIIMFIWGFNFLKGQNLFEQNARTFYIEYDRIQGLNESSFVTINGLQVGTVTDIDFNSDPSKKGKLVVTIRLDNDFPFSKSSVAKIYSTSFLGGEALAIIPEYGGELAESGDYLKGEIETDMLSSVKESLNPLKAKLSNLVIGADSLMNGLNDILNEKTRKSIKKTVEDLQYTVGNLNSTINTANSLMQKSGEDLNISLQNTKKITENVAQISDTLLNANIGQTIAKLETTLNNVNSLIEGIEKGEGTLGKLAKDETMYTNLTNASKELEELLREFKLNPKRFVHFSLFGKKPKPYTPEVEEKKEE